jgi:hypothetical protein
MIIAGGGPQSVECFPEEIWGYPYFFHHAKNHDSQFVGWAEPCETQQFSVELRMMLSFKRRVSFLYPTYELRITP